MAAQYTTKIWDKNNSNSTSPPDDLITNGFRSTTVGDNAWLNYIFNYVSIHCQIPVGGIINYDGNTYDGALLCNGSTIGSSASTATHADDIYESLFLILWAEYTVTPSRGASAADDWAANKAVAIPNYDGCVNVMKSSTTGSAFNVAVNTALGTETVSLTESNLPQIELTVNDPGHEHALTTAFHVTQDGPLIPRIWDSTEVGTSNNTNSATTGITIDPIGGDPSNQPNALPHNNIQPTMVTNKFIKY